MMFRNGFYLPGVTAVESKDHAKRVFNGSDGGPAPATKWRKGEGLAVKARVVVSSCRPFQLSGNIAHNPCAGKPLWTAPDTGTGGYDHLI